MKNQDAHGLHAYFHDALLHDWDRIDKNGNHINYVYSKFKADIVINHQKYKRCYAMAQFCFNKHMFLRYMQADQIQSGFKQNFISNERRIKLYEKWNKKWLELAKKFK